MVFLQNLDQTYIPEPQLHFEIGHKQYSQLAMLFEAPLSPVTMKPRQQAVTIETNA